MEEKDKRIAELEALLEKALARIKELERRLGLNSKNSSKPPSSDGLRKSSVPKSLREKGKNPTGGQKGHKGFTLEQVSTPTQIIYHELGTCPCCQGNLLSRLDRVIKRQVFDIPPIVQEVTEHQVEVKYCKTCKKDVQAPFPWDVTAPVQYGDRIKGVAIYLQQLQFIPEGRLQEVLQDLFHYPISGASISKFSATFSENIQELDKAHLQSIVNSHVRHGDETSMRIGGQTKWLHSLSTEKATHYRACDKRGDIVEGLESGVLVHDHFKSYYARNPAVAHSLCNAHHLRELKALIEIEKESWAKYMEKLLKLANKFPELCLSRIEKVYDAIVAQGINYHESLEPLPKGKRGKQKRRPGHNLLIRLRDFKQDVLRFKVDQEVPFTNNLAERDIRMMKVKQKISGGFRTPEGAIAFCRIRGFFSTLRKRAINILQAIQHVLQRQTTLLFPA